MNHRKILSVLLAALLLTGALAACAPAATAPEATATPTETATEAPAATDAPNGVTVTDMTGREITLDEPATRVIALSAADCEVLYAVGAGDLIVGRGEYCDYPAEVLEIPAVQSGMETNIEQIIALKPQVLLMSAMAQTEDQIAQLEAAGIKVVVSDAQNIEGVYAAITMMGVLTGNEAQAAEVISGMKTTFESLAARVGELEGKSVYFEVSPLQYGLWTAGGGTFMDEISTMLGLKNVFADVTGWTQVSEEQVLKANPDIIVTIAMYFGEGQTPEEEILSRAGWQDMTAVKNGDILNLQTNELSRPGPRLADGAKALFDFVLEVVTKANAA